jgi:hypothetical protein
MKKMLLAASLILASSVSYGACSTSEGIELCFDPDDSNLSKVLTDKEELVDIDGDGIHDVVKVDPTSKELLVYLGRECSGDVSALCYRQPHYTGIINNKGFLVKDLSGNCKADITVRTEDDKIAVWTQPSESGGGRSDDQFRSGDPYYVSILNTFGLTDESYTTFGMSSTPPYGKAPRASGAFDGYKDQGTRYVQALRSSITLSPAAEGFTSSWYSDSTTVKPWAQVKFNSPTSLNSLEVRGWPSGFEYLTVKYSNDGVNFTEHQSGFLNGVDLEFDKPSPFVNYARIYFRNATFEKSPPLRAPIVAVNDLQFKGWVKEGSPTSLEGLCLQ